MLGGGKFENPIERKLAAIERKLASIERKFPESSPNHFLHTSIRPRTGLESQNPVSESIFEVSEKETTAEIYKHACSERRAASVGALQAMPAWASAVAI